MIFYVDPRLAAADPDNYARSLIGLFGTSAKALLDAVLARLQEKIRVVKDSTENFGMKVEDARLIYRRREEIAT